jgi:hypothetical protein
MPDDDIVRLTTASNPAQAHLWCDALQEEGIECRVVGDYLDAGVGDIPGIRAELWVHRNDLERAQGVLAAHQREHPEGEEDESPPAEPEP